MRGLQVAVIVMGVLIVAGVAVIGVTIAKRTFGGPEAAVLRDVVLDEPQGSRIVAVSAGPQGMMVLVQGGGPDRVLVIDFKSNRPAPDRIDNADPAYITQMALYVAVLREIFKGRRIEAALIWTDGPKLMPVPENLIASSLAAVRRTG